MIYYDNFLWSHVFNFIKKLRSFKKKKKKKIKLCVMCNNNILTSHVRRFKRWNIMKSKYFVETHDFNFIYMPIIYELKIYIYIYSKYKFCLLF
jgi:hypothetical protein